MLFLTALDRQVNHREFSCALTSMEANFDLLSHIVAQGHTLLTAYVVEDSMRTDLPLAAFDGLPLSIGIQALQQEWQAILNKPQPSNSVHQAEFIELTRQRVHQYEVKILAHERMIDWLSNWLQRTQDRVVLEPIRSRLIQQYTAQLVVHQTQLVRARFNAELVTDRLGQLLA